MLGRIAPWKGQDLFLRAFADAFPAGGERAVLVGTTMFGEEDYERELRELVAQPRARASASSSAASARTSGPSSRRFDVLVHASVIPEPFGTVVLEGMAAGLAVIAADEGGPAEIIADGETGRLFRSRDQRSLAAAMRSLRRGSRRARAPGRRRARGPRAVSPGCDRGAPGGRLRAGAECAGDRARPLALGADTLAGERARTPEQRPCGALKDPADLPMHTT